MLRNRKRAFKALRWTVTILIVLLLLRSLDWRGSLRALQYADWRFVLLSLGVSLAGVAVSCVKWQWLLRVLGIQARFAPLIRWYLIGVFANNFLPTDVGGDVARGMYAGRAVGQYERVALSIIAERATGIAGMLGLALVGALLTLPMLGWLPQVILGSGVLGLALLLAAWRWRARLWRMAPAALVRPVAPMTEAWSHLKRALPGAVGISLVFHVLVALSNWLNLYAVGTRPPFLPLLALVPLISLLGMLPIAINGWGVREGAFVFLLTQTTGLAPGPLLAGALLGRAVILLTSLIGAPLTLYENRATRQIPHS